LLAAAARHLIYLTSALLASSLLQAAPPRADAAEVRTRITTTIARQPLTPAMKLPGNLSAQSARAPTVLHRSNPEINGSSMRLRSAPASVVAVKPPHVAPPVISGSAARPPR
jgi:hypothetical protein